MNNEEHKEMFDGTLENLPPIDVSKFKPMSTEELEQVLGKTIKKDNSNKIIAFLAQLSAFTENAQLNVSFNAPSSSGKSFIPMEVAKLFPDQDVVEVGYCSPTAFFHQVGEFDKEKGGYIVDLSRKILIFLDQPHTMLLQHLRPMLSHDKKEIQLKITDKSQKSGLRTKNIFLRGFPTVIFCTAGLRIDEQESTRFLLLSPEINEEKIKEAIIQRIRRDADSKAYEERLASDPDRALLIERIQAIKEENVGDIKIPQMEIVERNFLSRIKGFKPRHSRDIGKILSLIKAFALLNLWFREREGSVILANEQDIEEAYKIWDLISESQELNLPPYVYNLFKEVIIAAYNDRNGEDGFMKIGLSRQDIMNKHYELKGRFLPDWQLRQQIIPALEMSGLIAQEPDQNDKRKMLIFPNPQLTIPQNKNNSELGGGVDEEFEQIYAEELGNL